jgi:hypothetical protein
MIDAQVAALAPLDLVTVVAAALAWHPPSSPAPVA